MKNDHQKVRNNIITMIRTTSRSSKIGRKGTAMRAGTLDFLKQLDQFESESRKARLMTVKV